jgi:glucose-6-phosphate isomerase
MLGCEFIKTAGHYHPLAPGTMMTYPEIYEILEGEAVYLLQNLDSSDVVTVTAIAGDKVIVPPNYGHVTINCSNKILKMANFVARSFQSIYDHYRNNGGAAYFLTKDGWIANMRYKNAGKLRNVEAPSSRKLAELSLSKDREMYPLLRSAGSLDFLARPGEHKQVFEGLI